MPKALFSLVVLLLNAASSALAEDVNEGRRYGAERPFEVDLGVYVQPSMGDVCQRVASDVVQCANELPVGPLAGARFRFSEHVAVGGLGALLLSSLPDASSLQTRVAAQLRFMPLGKRARGLWLGTDAGLVHIADTVKAGELGAKTRYRSRAPAFGLGVGVAARLTRTLELALMLRGYLELFGQPDGIGGRQPKRETQVGGGLGLCFTLRP
ncbi:MAG: hypothetical protein RL385_2721 [Pseudomonadota bacterium]